MKRKLMQKRANQNFFQKQTRQVDLSAVRIFETSFHITTHTPFVLLRGLLVSPARPFVARNRKHKRQRQVCTQSEQACMPIAHAQTKTSIKTAAQAARARWQHGQLKRVPF